MDGAKPNLAHRLAGFMPVALLTACLAGCGTPASPLPPSLNLPMPVVDLTAARVGDAVQLAWTMPARTTDKVALRSPVEVQVCRAVQDGVCTVVASLTLPPRTAGKYTDNLPQDLTQNHDRLLRYEVAVRNRAGKSAGPSNAAFAAAGAAPPALGGLTAQVRADGVLLSWLPVPEPDLPVTYRIARLDVSPPASERGPKSPLAPATPSPAQTLLVHAIAGADPGHAIDASAQFNRQYRYTVQRVATPELAGHVVEMQGAPSAVVELTTLDKFPPAVPGGLVAVADSAAGAIDLSWSPDTESDLAAYQVYRRDTQTASPLQPLASPQVQTSFRDTTAQPGHAYAYAVSARDQSNNESRPSSEVEETLPDR